MKLIITAAFCLPVLAFAQADKSSQPLGPEDLSGTNGPPMLGIHWAKGLEPSFRSREANPKAGGKSPLMTYHNGPIMTTAAAEAIFWGTSWKNYAGDKITGIDSWYDGFGGSNYAKTNTEYTGYNGRVGSSTNHLGHVVDTSASVGGGSTSTIL